jgi:hypothetical protein
MSAKFLHPSPTRRSTLQARPPDQAWYARPGTSAIEWRAARTAERSCCCSATPVVIVVMPSGTSRPGQTDLLLCGHHYRMSRRSLAAAGATVLDINGVPALEDVWPEVHPG